MPQSYTPEFKKKIALLRLEEGRTINSITTEYSISKESVCRWCNEFQKECQAQSLQTSSSANEAEIMKENLCLLTSGLAVRALEKVLESQPQIKQARTAS